MVKTEYKMDLTMLGTVQSKTMIAIIGTVKEPKYAVFFDSKEFIVEDPVGLVFASSTTPYKIEERAREIIKMYERRVESLAKEEDEESEESYFCNNPDCPEQGLIIDPIYDGADYICPYCGEELDTEYTEEEFDLSYNRLLEVSYALWSYIEYTFGSSKEKYIELIKELAEYGIEEEEILYIEEKGGE